MRKFYTDAEINDLTASLRQSYEKMTHQENNWCLDIVDMMKLMFNLKVVYASIAEEDACRIGFLSDGVTPLWITKNGKRTQIVYPEDTVVLDKYLLRTDLISERNKTLGHECGHKIMFIQAPGLAKACFNAAVDCEKKERLDDLKEKLNLAELYADKFSIGLFMPKYLLERALNRYNNGEFLTLYGNYMLVEEDKIKLQKMADRLGVNYEDLFNRFKNLKMFNFQPAEKYTGHIIELEGVAW